MGGCVSKCGNQSGSWSPGTPPPDTPASTSTDVSRRSSFGEGPSSLNSLSNVNLLTEGPNRRSRASPLVLQSASHICDQIAALREEFVDFSSLDSMSSSFGLKKKYDGVSVEQYRESKGYPSGPADTRPPSINFHKFAAHGTNLTSVISALIHTNKQLVPGIKARKLGVKFNTGENRSVSFSEMNRKYVSAVAMNSMTSSMNDVKRYSKQSAILSPRGHLQSVALRSDTIPAVIIGDGVGGLYVSSDIGNEVGFKRVNIRIIALEAEDKKFAQEILNHLRIDDVKIITLAEIDTSSYERTITGEPEMTPTAYWEKLWMRA